MFSSRVLTLGPPGCVRHRHPPWMFAGCSPNVFVVSSPSAAVRRMYSWYLHHQQLLHLQLGNPTRACWPARKFSTSTQSTALLSTVSCVGPDLETAAVSLSARSPPFLRPHPHRSRLNTELHEDMRLRTRRRVGGCPEKSTTRALSGLTSLNLTSTLA